MQKDRLETREALCRHTPSLLPTRTKANGGLLYEVKNLRDPRKVRTILLAKELVSCQEGFCFIQFFR